jgi:hypothetical protein
MTYLYINLLSLNIRYIHPCVLIERIFLLKPNVMRNVHFYLKCYASNPCMGGLLLPCGPQNKTFDIRDLTFIMLPSFNQENNVNVTRDPTYYGPFTPWKTMIVPKEDPKCLGSYLSLYFLSLSLKISFWFLTMVHFPWFIASFTFWASFFNLIWSFEMRS